MKRIVAIGAGLACASACTSGWADTDTVTMHGRISTALESVRLGDAPSTVSMKSYSSRIGFKGKETLNEDLKAVFGIEASIASDTGANGFGELRYAYVGLKSASYGRLIAGRLDPFSNAPLYVQLIQVINPAGYDTGSLQILANSPRDTGHGTMVGYTGTPLVPSGLVSTATQTLLARARVSNAIGYDHSFGKFDVSARVVQDGTNDATLSTTRAANESGARAYEGSVTYKNGPLVLGLGLEKDQFAAATSALMSRFNGRIQSIAGYTIEKLVLGASLAQNRAEGGPTGVKLRGKEYALSATMPILKDQFTLIGNYAVRDLFGTDNSSPGAIDDPRPLATAGATRRQLAVGLRYDFSKRTQTYLVHNTTDPNSKVSNDTLKVLSLGMKHEF